jgi:hypothetical protein
MRLVLACSLLMLASAAQAWPYKGQTYLTEQQAQWGCRDGEVVWVDPATGRWFRKGDGRYAAGDDADGAYACRRDVEGAAAAAAKASPIAPPPLVPDPDYDDE